MELRPMRAAFRQLLRDISLIAAALAAIAERWSVDHLEGRLQTLERTRATWEAEVEASMMKVESRHQAVRAAEERIRHQLKRRNGNGEDDEPEPMDRAEVMEAYRAALEGAHAPAGPAQGVLALRESLADSAEASRRAARDRKWGRG